MSEGVTPPPDAEPPVCSARGCRAPGTWGVRWNNPRLHTPDRRKVWLACDEHRAQLEEYLHVRGFLKDTLPLAELPPDDGRPGPLAGAGR